MAIIDILIYVFFTWVMYSLAYQSVTKYDADSKLDKYLWGYMAFFTVICAIRWGVGVDSISYARAFNRGTTGHELLGHTENELIMAWLVHTIHDWGIHSSVGLGILAFLQIFFIVLALRNQKYILLTLPIVLFGSHYFMDLCNGTRQMIVACALLWASQFIVKRQAKYYFAFVLVASYMHHSALMLIPLYFIPRRVNIADHRKSMLVVLTVSFLAGLTPQFQSVVQYAENLATLAGYDNYADRVTEFLQDDYEGRSRAMGPMQLSYLLFGYISVYFGPILRQKYEKFIPTFHLWYLFSFFYICAYFLVCNISHIFIRPLDYFSLFHMLILSLVLFDYRSKEVFTFDIRRVATLLIMLLWINTSWQMVKANNKIEKGKAEFSTYKVFFMNNNNDEYDYMDVEMQSL